MFSAVMAVLGLSSLTETLVSWKGFIQNIVATYQEIVHPVFQFLFGWFPFEIPTFVFDYLTIGIFVGIVSANGLFAAGAKFQPERKIPGLEKPRWLVSIVAPFIFASIWPPHLVAQILKAIFARSMFDKYMARYIVKWLGIVAICFVVLLSINAML
ncbi:MAG: hypothetical protein ACR2NP_09605 [Pirellulaceae bacterium]